MYLWDLCITDDNSAMLTPLRTARCWGLGEQRSQQRGQECTAELRSATKPWLAAAPQWTPRRGWRHPEGSGGGGDTDGRGGRGQKTQTWGRRKAGW